MPGGAGGCRHEIRQQVQDTNPRHLPPFPRFLWGPGLSCPHGRALGPPFSGGRPPKPTPDARGEGQQLPRPVSHGAGAGRAAQPTPRSSRHGAHAKEPTPWSSRRAPPPTAATGRRMQTRSPARGPQTLFQFLSPRCFLCNMGALWGKYTLCKLKVSIMNKEKHQF